jgi:hypothetical protein
MEYKQIGNFTVGKVFKQPLAIHFCFLLLNRLFFRISGKTKGKGTFGKVKQGTHTPTGEKVNKAIQPDIILFLRISSSKNSN